MTSKQLFDKVKDLNIEYDNHVSDLYIPVTLQTEQLIDAYEFKNIVTTFISSIDGLMWYDVPFAYMPHWESVANTQFDNMDVS